MPSHYWHGNNLWDSFVRQDCYVELVSRPTHPAISDFPSTQHMDKLAQGDYPEVRGDRKHAATVAVKDKMAPAAYQYDFDTNATQLAAC
jgi:hypothetical protein